MKFSIMTLSIMTSSINDIQHNYTQHNDIQRNDTRHNGTQYNDTQHIIIKNHTRHKQHTKTVLAIMLCHNADYRYAVCH